MKSINAFLFSSLIYIFCIQANNLHAQTLPILVEEGTDVSLANPSGYLQLGYSTSRNLAMDDNEIQARNNGSTSTLYLNLEGGNVNFGDGFNPANAVISGFTKLGSNAPSIKTKLVTGTTSSSTTTIPHTMPDQSKIVSAYLTVETPISGNVYYEHYTIDWHDQTNVLLTSNVPTNRSYRLFITYVQ